MEKQMQKTTQALKIVASWTPNPSEARGMLADVFGAENRLQYSGGRIRLLHAIKLDFSVPADAVRVSERAAQIKAELEEKGTLHSFATFAGAVPVEEAEILPDLAATPATGAAA
jgi:hypothetical protein